MWEIKLLNINDKEFLLIKEILEEKIYSKCLYIQNQLIKEYYLILDDKDISSAPEALSKGADEIKIISSILSILGYNNSLEVDCPYEIHEDGTRTLHLTFIDKIKILDEINIYSNNSLVFSTEQTRELMIKNFYLKSKNSLVKKQLINFLSQEINWVNSYKIYEILKDNFKKEKELKKYLELATFAHTANSPKAIGESARHAIQNTENPRNIASLESSYKKLKELSFEFLLS